MPDAAGPEQPPRAAAVAAAVFAGGLAGTVMRVALAQLAPTAAAHWPWATLAANLAGAALLGFVAARARAGTLARPLVGVGFCGGLTTFSALQLELLRMLDAGRLGPAAAYAAATIGAGLVAVGLGGRLGRRATP